MRINTNVASLTAQEAAKNTAKSQTSSLEKLGTGLQINKASDDGAGLAIADKLRTQATSIGQSISNANSASALVNIADKAMSEQSNILDTIKSKLIQAGTDTTTDDGREAIRKDITKLLEQFDNIASQTNYNGMTLLQKAKDDTSAADEFSFQIGEDASYDISLKTDKAANTESLGATEDKSIDSEAVMRVGSAGSLNIAADDSAITVKNTSTATNRLIAIGGTTASGGNATGATDVAVEINAKNVDFLGFNATSATGEEITLETDDQALIATLNAMASENVALVKVSDGIYTLGNDTVSSFGNMAGDTQSGVIGLEFNGGVDLTNLKISGISLDRANASENETVFIGSKEDVTVKKLSGDTNINISGSSEGNGAGTLSSRTVSSQDDVLEVSNMVNPDGFAMSLSSDSAMVIDQGTVTMKVDQSTAAVADAAIAIGAMTTGGKTSEASFKVSADDVEKIILAGDNASVVLSSEDANTSKKLAELAQYNDKLTDIGNGSFQLATSTGGSSAELDFGSEGIDISNLNFSGVKNDSAAGNESIFIQTDSGVTVTKNGGADDQDISIQASNGSTPSGRAVLETTDKGSISGSLAELKALGEGELTSEVANNMMETVDNALTQLNSIRADFGSTQNQLESSIRNLETTFTNIKAAESVIRDVDYAKESASFNKQNIIAQAGTYAMSQANAMQQNVSRLLQ